MREPENIAEKDFYRAVFIATYAAYFVAQMRTREAEGLDCDDRSFDRFAEEAKFVANEAALRSFQGD